MKYLRTRPTCKYLRYSILDSKIETSPAAFLPSQAAESSFRLHQTAMLLYKHGAHTAPYQQDVEWHRLLPL